MTNFTRIPTFLEEKENIVIPVSKEKENIKIPVSKPPLDQLRVYICKVCWKECKYITYRSNYDSHTSSSQLCSYKPIWEETTEDPIKWLKSINIHIGEKND